MNNPVINNSVQRERWELILSHRERLCRLVASRLGRVADVEDCVHEALIRAATFHGLDESRVGALLTTIALRLCFDYQRNNLRQRKLVVRSLQLEQRDLEAEVCEQAVGAWLLDLTSSLGPRERQVMLARAQGMSTAEAAEALEISQKSAESAFTRARSRLRGWYDDEMALARPAVS